MTVGAYAAMPAQTTKQSKIANDRSEIVDASTEQTHEDEYRVVVNDEEQYSLWPAFRAIPVGWADALMTGTKEDCLEFIRANWTDMRPKSMRGA